MRRLAWLTLAVAAASHAHEVSSTITQAPAIVITLSYADGKPFAYEKYALYPSGSDVPRQVGNTDAAGRLVFVPDGATQWRLTATSADGHGITLEFAATATSSGTLPNARERLPRGLAFGCGLAILFGLFGLLQLFVRKEKNAPPPR